MVRRDMVLKTAERTKFKNHVKCAVLQEISGPEKTAASLPESIENLKTYLEGAPDGVFFMDLKGTFLYGNKKAEEISGYKRDELIGKSFLNLKLLQGKHLPRAAGRLAVLKMGKSPGSDEFELTTRNGNRIWIQLSTTPIKEQGRMVVIGFVRNITEHKLADGKRRAILKTAIDGFWVTDVDGRILDVNDSYCRMTGYSRKELLKMSIQDIEIAETREEVNRHIKRIAKQGHDRFETQHRRKDGRIIDIEISVNYFKADREQLFIFARDITERKKAEKEIEASEQRYRLLVENANQSIVVVQDGVFKFANAKTAELSGYSKEELLLMPMTKIIHPDDSGIVINRYLRRLKGESISGVYHFRCVRKDGRLAWVEQNAILIDWEGKPATLNFINDISERKRTEEKMKESYEKLRKTVDATIRTIALISEIRDPYTTGHQRHVAKLASAIAGEMGFSEEQIETIRVAGTLHDIGKVNVPIEILSKTDKISDVEFRLVKAHPQAAVEMLKSLELPWNICPIILHHHERLNGAGYPEGLSGEKIEIGARVLAVADVIEAISSHRPYRVGLGIDKALEEIKNNRGILYDGEVVDACLSLFRDKGFRFDEGHDVGPFARTRAAMNQTRSR
jgi:PAS domain S-box-containing protein/putative nucleotidyltransferase with HDIG domain